MGENKHSPATPDQSNMTNAGTTRIALGFRDPHCASGISSPH
jgi:hypothetical protein